MAQDQKAAEPTPSENPAPASPKAPFPIFALLNLVAILGVLGFLYYSKFIFKRPRITEDKERERLVAKKEEHPIEETLLIAFEPITVNLSPSIVRRQLENQPQKQTFTKLPVITVGFSLEIRDPAQKELIEDLRPFILDKIIYILGKKQFNELITVQGRYILHSQLIEMTNQIVATRSEEYKNEDLVTNLYFTQFTVQ